MKNQNRVYRNRGKNGGEDLLRIKARNKSKSVAVGNFKNGAHIFPRGSIERRRFTRVAPKSAPPLNKSAGLRNKTFLQRDKFITKITAIERRGGAAREEGGGRGTGRGKVEQGLCGRSRYSRTICNPWRNGTSYSNFKRRRVETIAPASPDIKDAESRLNRHFHLIRTYFMNLKLRIFRLCFLSSSRLCWAFGNYGGGVMIRLRIHVDCVIEEEWKKR